MLRSGFSISPAGRPWMTTELPGRATELVGSSAGPVYAPVAEDRHDILPDSRLVKIYFQFRLPNQDNLEEFFFVCLQI